MFKFHEFQLDFQIDANFIAQYQMNYGSHVADASDSSVVKQAQKIASVTPGVASNEKTGEHNQSQDWKYYYDLAVKYAPQEGVEQSAEDKKYYDYYTYYYQYYYSLEGQQVNPEDMTDEQKEAQKKYEEEYKEYCEKHGTVSDTSKEGQKTEENENYESREYWEQYQKENFVPKVTTEDIKKKEKEEKGKKKKDKILEAPKRKAEEGKINNCVKLRKLSGKELRTSLR